MNQQIINRAFELMASQQVTVCAWNQADRYTGEMGILIGSPYKKVFGFGLTLPEALADLGETLATLHPEVEAVTPDEAEVAKALSLVEEWFAAPHASQESFGLLQGRDGVYHAVFQATWAHTCSGKGRTAAEAVANASEAVAAGLARLAEYRADPRGVWKRRVEQYFAHPS